MLWGTWREVDCLALTVPGRLESGECTAGTVMGLPLDLPGIYIFSLLSFSEFWLGNKYPTLAGSVLLEARCLYMGASLVAQKVKRLPAMRETWV